MGQAFGKSESIDFNSEVELRHFNLLRCVGKGAFGKVRIVEHRESKKLYALKYINKAQCIKIRAVQNIIRERYLLEEIEHPFIVNLRYAFQDDENMFMVIDLMMGGDLRFHLDRMGGFSEEMIRFFAAEISCALNYLHNKGILHRDLKPDNILLDTKGHSHITDFNIATKVDPKKPPRSQSGTLAYMAPEVFLGKGYTYSIDWWGMGIILYECLYGRRPFKGQNNEQLSRNIISQTDIRFPLTNHITKYPVKITQDCLIFIKELLIKDPTRRLACRQAGLDDLWDHPWLAGIDWDKLERKEYTAPFIPDSDRANFDATYDLEELLLEDNPLMHKPKKKKKENKNKSFKHSNNNSKPKSHNGSDHSKHSQKSKIEAEYEYIEKHFKIYDSSMYERCKDLLKKENLLNKLPPELQQIINQTTIQKRTNGKGPSGIVTAKLREQKLQVLLLQQQLQMQHQTPEDLTSMNHNNLQNYYKQNMQNLHTTNIYTTNSPSASIRSPNHPMSTTSPSIWYQTANGLVSPSTSFKQQQQQQQKLQQQQQIPYNSSPSMMNSNYQNINQNSPPSFLSAYQNQGQNPNNNNIGSSSPMIHSNSNSFNNNTQNVNPILPPSSYPHTKPMGNFLTKEELANLQAIHGQGQSQGGGNYGSSSSGGGHGNNSMKNTIQIKKAGSNTSKISVPLTNNVNNINNVNNVRKAVKTMASDSHLEALRMNELNKSFQNLSPLSESPPPHPVVMHSYQSMNNIVISTAVTNPAPTINYQQQSPLSAKSFYTNVGHHRLNPYGEENKDEEEEITDDNLGEYNIEEEDEELEEESNPPILSNSMMNNQNNYAINNNILNNSYGNSNGNSNSNNNNNNNNNNNRNMNKTHKSPYISSSSPHSNSYSYSHSYQQQLQQQQKPQNISPPLIPPQPSTPTFMSLSPLPPTPPMSKASGPQEKTMSPYMSSPYMQGLPSINEKDLNVGTPVLSQSSGGGGGSSGMNENSNPGYYLPRSNSPPLVNTPPRTASVGVLRDIIPNPYIKKSLR